MSDIPFYFQVVAENFIIKNIGFDIVKEALDKLKEPCINNHDMDFSSGGVDVEHKEIGFRKQRVLSFNMKK